MLRYITFPFRFLALHLWASLTAALLLGIVVVAGVNGWAWYHYRAADAALRVDDMDAAQHHIGHCLRVWRFGAATQFLAARIERVSGHYPQADEHLRECVHLQHGASDQSQLEEVLLRAQSGDFKEVEAGLWACVDKDHLESARILETLARIYMRDSRMQAAQHCLTKWLELEPEAVRAWHWRGWVRERLQQPEKAVADYEKAVELEPGRWGVHLRLARLLLERHNLDAAQPHLDELMRSHPDDTDVQIAQAQGYMLEGKNEEASQLLDQLLQQHPKDFEALYYRGQLDFLPNPPRYAEAEEFLRRALAERPKDYRALHLFYECLEKQGKAQQAAEAREKHRQVEMDSTRLRELWNREIERAPHNPEVLSEVGELMLKLGDDSGVQWLKRALHEDQTHQRSLEVLIRYYESKGDTKEADMYRQHLPRTSAAASSSGN